MQECHSVDVTSWLTVRAGATASEQLPGAVDGLGDGHLIHWQRLRRCAALILSHQRNSKLARDALVCLLACGTNPLDSESLCSPDTYAESFGRDVAPSLLNTTDLYGLTSSCIRVLRFMEAANLSAGCQPSSEACCQGPTRRGMQHSTVRKATL